ncbi:MAG: metallopeptidase family protein [Pirellulales bacterium]
MTLVVEDEPAPDILKHEGLDHAEELCGYFVGISKLDEHVDIGYRLPNRIYVYREGNLAQACDEEGNVDPVELRRQIRITILHEVGHYLGLNEDELEELGYG